MANGVSIRHLRHIGVAECEGCTIDPDSTREQCRAHVRETGHTVRYIVEDSTTYRPDETD